MKKIQILTIITLLIACNGPDDKSLYEEYIDSYRTLGFANISDILADTILIKDINDYEAQYSRQEFKMHYQWDSVFQPAFEIISLSETDSTIDVTQSVSSKRLHFLGNSPLRTKKRIYIANGQLSIIENLEYLNVDWEVWIAKRDSLVNWIDSNHPDLSGFIHDMTKKGAEDYLEAIKLYQNPL